MAGDDACRDGPCHKAVRDTALGILRSLLSDIPVQRFDPAGEVSAVLIARERRYGEGRAAQADPIRLR
jgi:hypothetical protein